MFENLTEKLQRVFKNLRGQGKLTEEHLDAALGEIREAMLEGDVAVSVVDELLANIRKKALGSEVLLQLSPDQQVVKIVRDELLALLGKHAKPLFASRPPSVWLLVGRSEEHTSELQSPCNLVCRLLLEKKKTNIYI